jgi:hypothetical protein
MWMQIIGNVELALTPFLTDWLPITVQDFARRNATALTLQAAK